MGKRARKLKQAQRQERLYELRFLGREKGIEIQEYNLSRHLRIFGPTVYDYWPGSGRAWRTGSMDKGVLMTPAEVIEASRQARIVVDQESAISHMRSIAQEDSDEVPW